MTYKTLLCSALVPFVVVGTAIAQTPSSAPAQERTFYRTGEVKRVPVGGVEVQVPASNTSEAAAVSSATQVSSASSVISEATSSEAMKPAAPAENDALYPPENSGGVLSVIMRYAGSVLSLVAGVGILMFMKRRKKIKTVVAAAESHAAALPIQEPQTSPEAPAAEAQA